MDDNVTTAREALMAELLQDVDALLYRLEQVDKSLADKIEQATKDAAAQAFLAARFNFTSMIDEQERKLTDAGRHAAALIGNQLNVGAAQLVAANETLERKVRRLILLAVGFALVAGIVSGTVSAAIVTKLVGT